MKPENSICVEIENFLQASETRFDFRMEEYRAKYKEILYEQQLIDDAAAFDEKVLVLKSVYDQENEKFSKKLNKLLMSCLQEYSSFSEDLKLKIRTAEILEQLRVASNIYFSAENVLKRKEELKQKIISWSMFTLITLLSIGFSIYFVLTGFTLKDASIIVVGALAAVAGIILVAASIMIIKKWYLCIPASLFSLLLVIIFVLNKLAFEEGQTLFEFIGL